MKSSLFVLSCTLIVLSLLNMCSSEWWNMGMLMKQIRLASNDSVYILDEQEFFLKENGVITREAVKDKIIPNITRYCQNREMFKSAVQRRICSENPEVIQALSRASELAMDKCSKQFRYSRWNCSAFNQTDMYGPIPKQRSKETAYLYAINAAASVFHIVRGCLYGYIKNCSCDYFKVNKYNVTITRCLDFVDYAHQMSRTFLDSQEYAELRKARKSARVGKLREQGLMNIINNESGRLATVRMLKYVLECVDKPCTGDNSLPFFQSISDLLASRYTIALRIKGTDSFERRSTLRKLVSTRSLIDYTNYSNQTWAELVFVDDSPDYCEFSRGRVFASDQYSVKQDSETKLLSKCKDICCSGVCRLQKEETRYECVCRFNQTTDSSTDSATAASKANCEQCIRVRSFYVCN